MILQIFIQYIDKFFFSGIGPNYRKKACWITASGDQTFVKIDESLVNVNSLAKINIAADRNTISKIN